MVELFNRLDIHFERVSHIDALTLLHFIGDCVKDWECNGECDKGEQCPFLWEFTHMPEGVLRRCCLLESIKDNAYVHLEKPVDEYGNPITEEQVQSILFLSLLGHEA